MPETTTSESVIFACGARNHCLRRMKNWNPEKGSCCEICYPLEIFELANNYKIPHERTDRFLGWLPDGDLTKYMYHILLGDGPPCFGTWAREQMEILRNEETDRADSLE